MKSLRWIVFALLTVPLPVRAAPENPIKLHAVQQEERHHLYATNSAPAPVPVVVEVAGTNISADREWPQVFVINAGATLDLGYVRGADPEKGYSFNTRYYTLSGDFRAKEIPDAPCRLPYPDGEAYLMSQTFGGTLTSHADPLMQQAIDFTMPEGTSVLAARDGIVITVIDTFTTGGIDSSFLEMANQVWLQHDDGTVTVYAHLFPHSAQVIVGQHVRAGELLAKSGNTGFSAGPHLHFALIRPKLGEDKVFRAEALPIHFYTGLPKRILVPVEGLLATAAQDGPAKVQYRKMGSGQASSSQILIQRIPPAPTQPPIAGNVPILDTRPLAPKPPLPANPREYPWQWLIVLVSFVVVVRHYLASRSSRRRRDTEW